MSHCCGTPPATAPGLQQQYKVLKERVCLIATMLHQHETTPDLQQQYTLVVERCFTHCCGTPAATAPGLQQQYTVL